MIRREWSPLTPAAGYPLPTNLDLDQPVGSRNPETRAELALRLLDPGWPAERFAAQAWAGARRRQTD